MTLDEQLKHIHTDFTRAMLCFEVYRLLNELLKLDKEEW